MADTPEAGSLQTNLEINAAFSRVQDSENDKPKMLCSTDRKPQTDRM